MSSANKPAAQAPGVTVSFVDSYGATVTIPVDEVANYAGVKAEQLRAITQLLAGESLDEPDARKFAVIANALAGELESLIDLLQEGGA